MDYYEIDLPSNSGLTALKRELEGQPGIFAKEETLELGRVFHDMVYQPDLADLTALSHTSKQLAYRMTKSARECPIIRFFLAAPAAKVEQLIVVKLFGVWFKCKPDIHIPGRAVHDLKSTACTSFADFVAKCIEYGYFRQAVCYKAATGAKSAYITGISKSAGHQRFLIDCSKFPAEMKQAKQEVRSLLKAYQNAKGSHS